MLYLFLRKISFAVFLSGVLLLSGCGGGDNQPQDETHPDVSPTPQADMTVSHFSLDQHPPLVPGATVPVRLALSNQGQAAAAGFQVSLYLFQSGSDGEPFLWRNLVVDGQQDELRYPPDSEDPAAQEIDTPLPEDLNPGKWFAVVDVDPDDVVTESDETNNRKVVGPFTVSQPASVVSSSPSPDALDVPLDSVITVRFDRPMDGSTMVEGNIGLTVLGRFTVPTQIAYQPEQQTVTIDPDQPLVGGQLYTVALSEGVKDENGIRLAPASWAFTTHTDYRMVNSDTGRYTMGGAATRLTGGPLDGQALMTGGARIIAGPHPQLASLPNEVYGDPRHARLFDPATESFENLPAPELPQHILATLTPLDNGDALLAGGYLYAPTDPPQQIVYRATQIFDAENKQWVAGPDMSYPRIHHQAVRLQDGRVLIVGGLSFDSQGHLLVLQSSNLFSSDGTSVEWGPVMNVERYRHSAITLPDGRVLVVGGEDANGVPRGSAEVYDPATGRFDLLPDSLSTPRANARLVLFNNQVLIMGGHDRDRATLASVEVFDPASNQFMPLGKDMHTPREAFQVVAMDNGTLLVFGGLAAGYSGNQFLDFTARNTSEIYDGSQFRHLDTAFRETREAYPSVVSFGDKALVLTGGFAYYEDSGRRSLSGSTAAMIFEPDP